MIHATPMPQPDDEARRERAKMRLYVLCQTVGWGLFLAVQLVISLGLSAPRAKHDWLVTAAMILMLVTLGLLLTHYFRRLIRRWAWRDLGWRALLPRVLVAAVSLAALWNLITFAYSYGVLREEWDSKHSPVLIFGINWVNLSILMLGWFSCYFIYHLFDRFNRLEIDRLRLMAAVKDSELRALKSQVNPHFIFNSLNSLRALIDEDPARARLAVTQLANLLRYSLQSSQLETVPFEDELRVVNDYLALEQVRHEERLRLRLDVAPETLHLPVPPMLLQTLVENAVKYGISQHAEGGEIAIIARNEAGFLRLQVTNPGSLPLVADAGSRVVTARREASTGLGLRNAGERLRLLFGERASLELRAMSPAVVMAEALIPLRPVSA